MKHSFILFTLIGLLATPFMSTTSKAKAKVKSATTAASESFKIDAAASRLNWKGTKLAGAHTGKIQIKDGDVQVLGTELKGGTVTIDMASLVDEDLTDATYNAKLVGHLKSDDFFGVVTYPTAVFKITSVKAATAAGTFDVTGDLTIKGKTNPITFPAKIAINGSVLTASATAKVDRTKYDIRYGSGKFFENLGDKLIHDEFELSFELTAKK